MTEQWSQEPVKFSAYKILDIEKTDKNEFCIFSIFPNITLTHIHDF